MHVRFWTAQQQLKILLFLIYRSWFFNALIQNMVYSGVCNDWTLLVWFRFFFFVCLFVWTLRKINNISPYHSVYENLILPELALWLYRYMTIFVLFLILSNSDTVSCKWASAFCTWNHRSHLKACSNTVVLFTIFNLWSVDPPVRFTNRKASQ